MPGSTSASINKAFECISTGVLPGRRTLALIVLLAGIIVAFAALSRRSIIGGEPTPPSAPRLIRIAANPLEIDAEAVLIRRLKTGEDLFSRGANTPLPIASLTKLMTALIFAEAADPLSAIPLTADAKRAGQTDAKRSSIPAGERLKAEDILAFILAASDTDTAFAAAEYAIASIRPETASYPFHERMAAFVALMNSRAAEFGMAATRYGDPAGGEDPGNFSTANDLARLADVIWRARPQLWAPSRIRESFAFSENGRRYSIVNTNALLTEFPSLYGAKTGLNDKARGALVLIYRLAVDEPIAIVILRSPDRFAEGRAAIKWLEENFAIGQ